MLGFYRYLEEIVLTCRRDPSGLSWVIIKGGCIDQNIRSKEENCSDLEEPHEYNACCSSMKDQESFWNVCRAIQSSSSGEILLDISY